MKSNLMVTCGDSEVKIVNIDVRGSPSLFEPVSNYKAPGLEAPSFRALMT